MERRELFTLGARKAAQAALRMAREKVARRARSWLRPPFAEDELDFLLSCTRCNKCIEACGHGVLFRLPARLGPGVAGTPAMDLLNRGCRLCPDWACVNACEPQALRLPDRSADAPPAQVRLARLRVDPDACLPYAGPECGACAHACPISGALEWRGGTRPVINAERCVGCALCREACIVAPKAITVAAVMPEEETAEVA